MASRDQAQIRQEDPLNAPPAVPVTDIPALLASDAIVLLPDWQTSRGASLEVWIAIDLDLPVYRYDIYDGDIILERVEAPTMDRLPFERGDAPRQRSTHPRRNEP